MSDVDTSAEMVSAEIVWLEHLGGRPGAVDMLRALVAERDELRSQLNEACSARTAPKVKPLVWEDFEEGAGAKANAIGPLNYLILLSHRRGDYALSYSLPGYGVNLTENRSHKTLDEAKKAAQNDLQSLIE